VKHAQVEEHVSARVDPAAPGRMGIVMDLDGTVWVDGRMIPGAAECLRWLRSSGFPLVYLTNNPVRPEVYASRLARHGLPTEEAEVITASAILRDYLQQTAPGATLFVLADEDVRTQFEPGFGFSDDPARIDVVVATAPTMLDYRGLIIAHRALCNGARFVATNGDPACPAPDGGEVPHAAALIAALEATTRRRPECVAGKPSALAADQVRRRLGRPAQEILVVGDSLDTDMRFARDNGMQSALVLTGVGRAERAADPVSAPDHILSSLADLPALLQARA
jgi:NagD protein